jgi:hypothetical protein
MWRAARELPRRIAYRRPDFTAQRIYQQWADPPDRDRDRRIGQRLGADNWKTIPIQTNPGGNAMVEIVGAAAPVKTR